MMTASAGQMSTGSWLANARSALAVGAKMATRSMQFFCKPEELFGLLREKLVGDDQVSFFEEKVGQFPIKRIGFDELILDPPRYFYLGISLMEPTRFLGLIQVCRPQYKNDALCMASIGIKTEWRGESLDENLPVYDRLSRFMKKKLKSGLWGINTKHGGDGHFYRDIYISDGAISEFRHGLELAPHAAEDFVRYQYRGE